MSKILKDILEKPPYTTHRNTITGCLIPDKQVLDYDTWERRIRERLMKDHSFCKLCAMRIDDSPVQRFFRD